MKKPHAQRPPPEISHEDVLNKIEAQNLIYLVHGVAPYFRGDKHNKIEFLFGWNSSLQEVRFSEPHGPVFIQIFLRAHKINPRYVWVSENPVYPDDRPDRGLHALNIKRMTTFQVGDYHYEDVVHSSPSSGSYTLGLPVFDLFSNYRDLLAIDLNDWSLEDQSKLIVYAASRDVAVLRVLAMNETVPAYILAQLWEDEDDMTRVLVRQNENVPAWLQR